ncbi:MAG: hypothetical protein COA43_11490 [Robiginitomaculum sp.]|nr:MAG: hypothetical protein COA43_11490 [Robiginitomaculum sp.]
MLSILEQNNRLLRDFPNFKMVVQKEKIGVWQGWVKPSEKYYLLKIEYELPQSKYKQDFFQYIPHVRFWHPSLLKMTDYQLAHFPHVYPARQDEPDRRPILCICLPGSGDWNWDHFISETTIPDACEWLQFYEIWQVTGIWYGGGKTHKINQEIEYAERQKVIRNLITTTSPIALAAG